MLRSMRIARRRIARRSPVLVGPALLLAAGAALAGCSSGTADDAGSGALSVVAAENVWGSLAEQLGGENVEVRSIIDSPDADPHDYEPTAADGRAVATADLLIVNGAGYDPWAARLAAANPSESRVLLDAGEFAASDGGDPHLWYDPRVVDRVVERITAAYVRLDPSRAADYEAAAEAFRTTGLAHYTDAIEDVRDEFGGTPIGGSESVVAPLAAALDLDLVTPPGLLAAVSEGVDPTARDKRTADEQIASRQIAVYVHNAQNTTPDVRAQVEAATEAGIPVVAITETLTPTDATFQAWQTAQFNALREALSRGAGQQDRERP